MINKALLSLCEENGIKDGLLREFIGKGLYDEAIEIVEEAVQTRYRQIEFLTQLKEGLTNGIGNILVEQHTKKNERPVGSNES